MARDPICGMEVSENTPFAAVKDAKKYFFCSARCLAKFAEDNKTASCCTVSQGKAFYKNKTFVVAAVLCGLVACSYAIPLLEPFRRSFLSYASKLWWAVLLGIFLGGIIDYSVPREYISYVLASGKKRAILYAVVLGFFMSACSHGILALSMQLHKKGASNPSVVAFLLASPWANFTLTILLIGFFGAKGLFIIFGAMGIALITGFIFQFLEKKDLIEKNDNAVVVEKDFSLLGDLRKRAAQRVFSPLAAARGIYQGMVALADMVLWWILIGVGIASLLGAYVPSGFFHHYMGPTLFGLIVTLLFATVIEVCSEGSAPMAFEIFKQTGAFGNSFVFLMAGVVTDYTEIGLLWHNVGRKTALWLPLVTVPQVVLLGVIANKIW